MRELGDFAAFNSLSQEGRRLLKQNAVNFRYAAGKTIVEKGNRISGAYFVLSGHLRVFTLLPDGKDATLYFVTPGEPCILALNSLFNDLLYPAWVRTGPDTNVAVVPGRVYRTLFESESAVRDLTIGALSTLVFRLMSELDQVHSCTLEQRVASFLLVHASGQRVVRQTQQEIAGHMGTSREVVARSISRMSARGWIATRRGEVTILRPAALAKLAQEA
ncbi:MAG: Crp/Fnr family transcriptional regulator [Acidobacteriia bacterium]|nr:Crp/Fnr family transcriptional regulator [Terriglobia bacterium]